MSGEGISWYRSPVDRALLRELTARSNARAWRQVLTHLGLLLATGAGAWAAWRHSLTPLVIGLVFLHGTIAAFLLNGLHELGHGTVFESKKLNGFFLRLFAFITWNSHTLFNASHTRHHQYTLHPPDDLEVVLPVPLRLKDFLFAPLVGALGFLLPLGATLRLSAGRLAGGWEERLFPESNPAARARLFRWARFTLAGHVLILAAALHFRLWLVPFLFTFCAYCANWLLFLCNHTQHTGLMDRTPDYRLCCRTIELNPLIRTLYWQMNYHTEHHMYAAVPFYNLGRLHQAIQADLPPTPRGLRAAWREILGILRRQRQDPAYQHVAAIPRGR